jgi:uncharacterized protein YkwD
LNPGPIFGYRSIYMKKISYYPAALLILTQLSFIPPVKAPIAQGTAPAGGLALQGSAPATFEVADIPSSAQILVYVNKFRAQNGKSPLALNKDMDETAGIHSQAMAKGTVPFGHDNFDLRFKYVAAKLGRIDEFAENVAMGMMNAEQVVNAWIHSPQHRENMLGPYNLTGISAAEAGNGQIYFTEIFAHQQP